MLYYSLHCFQESRLIQDIILVTSEDVISYCKEQIVDKYGFSKVRRVIPGGKERYDSVYAGLLACDDPDYVFIHDGARPFINEEILRRGLSAVQADRSLCNWYAFQGYREDCGYPGKCTGDTR